MLRPPLVRLAYLAPFGVFATAAACGGNTTTQSPTNMGTGMDPGPAVPVAETDFESAYVDAFCGVSTQCCAPGTAPTAEQCRANILMNGGMPPSRPPNTVYDANKAGECVAAVRRLTTNCLITNPQDDAISELCNAIYVGTLAPGAACQAEGACVPPAKGIARCQVPGGDNAVGTSVCTVIPVGEQGDPCLMPGFGLRVAICDADVGLFCDTSGAPGTGTCVAQRHEGEPCDGLYPDDVCAPGLTCGEPAPRVCIKLLPLGAACNGYARLCESGSCVHDVCASGQPLATSKLCE